MSDDSAAIRICVVIPTYNNAATISGVIDSIRPFVHDIIVVDDGSTDGTSELLASQPAVEVVTHERNRGKGQALISGFQRAATLGFTHAITMDADGQHRADELPRFIDAVTFHPSAMVIGTRDLKGAGPYRKSRLLRFNSNIWAFIQTGRWIADTQSGFRVYPLGPILKLRTSTNRYDYEVESLVKAVWCGTPIHEVPITVRYGTGSKSHFRPLHDFALVSLLNIRLTCMLLLLPLALRQTACTRYDGPDGFLARTAILIRATMQTMTPRVFAVSAGMGVMCGILPIWGFQGTLAIVAAHKLRLSRLVALVASNISFPAMLPLVLYISLITGNFVLTGRLESPLRLDNLSLQTVWSQASAYVVGSVVLAVVAGAVATASIWLAALIAARGRKEADGQGPYSSGKGKAIAAITIVIGLAVLLGDRLQVSQDIESLLPAGDPVVDDYRLVMRNFAAPSAVFISIGVRHDIGEHDEGYVQNIAAVADAFHEQLKQSGAFRSIFYRFTVDELKGLLDLLSNNVASLLAPDDLAALEERLTSEEIRRRLTSARNRLVEPSGVALKEMLRRDPLYFGELSAMKLQYLGTQMSGARFNDGRIWSQDERHLLMILDPHASPTDATETAALIDLIETAAAEAALVDPLRAVRISYAGQHRGVLENSRAIRRDVERAVTATAIGIAVLGMLVYRRKRFALLIFLPAAFGIACASMLFSVAWPEVSAIAIGCGAAIIGIAVDYAIHVAFAMETSRDATEALSKMRSLHVPIAMGSVTTASASLCLLLSSLQAQRQIGIFVAAGIIAAAFCAMFLLPFLLRQTATPSAQPPLLLVKLSKRILQWRDAYRTSCIALLAVMLAVAGGGLTKLRFEGDVTLLDYQSKERLIDESVLQNVWQGHLEGTSVVLTGRTLDQAMESNDRLFELLKELSDSQVITSFSSIAAVLPSPATQDRNRRAWEEFWSDRRASMEADFRHEMQTLRFSPTAFEPFFSLLSAETGSIRLDDISATALAPAVTNRIASGEGQHLVLSSFQAPDGVSARIAMAMIRDVLPNAIILNKRHLVEHLSDTVRRDLKMYAVAAGVVTMLVLLSFLRHVELMITAIAPVSLSVILTLGTMGLLGVPINLISSLFVIFVFGVGVDYSIFMLDSGLAAVRGESEREAIASSAVIVCSLTTLCGFITLTAARHPALFSVGFTASVGMLFSLITAFLLVPAILRLLVPGEGQDGIARNDTLSLASIGLTIFSFAFLAFQGLLYVVFLKLPAALLIHDRQARQQFARRFVQHTAAFLLKGFRLLGNEHMYFNATRDTFNRPAVIVSNHLSAFDIMGVLSLPGEIALTAKHWVWRVPLMGTIIHDAGFIRISPGGYEDFVASAIEMLNSGVSVAIFPEGTRSRDGRMHRFHKGAFELAIRANADLLPVLLCNTQAAMAPLSCRIERHRCSIRVLPRMTPETCDYSMGPSALAALVREKLARQLVDDWRLVQSGSGLVRTLRSLYRYCGKDVEREVDRSLDSLSRLLDELVPRNGVVSELYCGYGIAANMLAWREIGRSVIGIDSDSRKIKVAVSTLRRCSGIQLGFRLSDPLHDELPHADAVVITGPPDHLTTVQMRTLLEKASASLRPGGVMILHRMSSRWRSYEDLLSACRLRANDSFPATGVSLRREISVNGDSGSSLVIFER